MGCKGVPDAGSNEGGLAAAVSATAPEAAAAKSSAQRRQRAKAGQDEEQESRMVVCESPVIVHLFQPAERARNYRAREWLSTMHHACTAATHCKWR